jgi:hypothetical protein
MCSEMLSMVVQLSILANEVSRVSLKADSWVGRHSSPGCKGCGRLVAYDVFRYDVMTVILFRYRC